MLYFSNHQRRSQKMAGPTTWSMLQNYLVNDGARDPLGTSNFDDFSLQGNSPWARMVRERLGLSSPGQQMQQTFAIPIGNTPWSPLQPRDRLGAEPAPALSSLPHRDMPVTSSLLQDVSPFTSQFEPLPGPPSVSDGSRMPQSASWPGSLPFEQSMPPGPMPVGHAGTARPSSWPLPGVFDPWGPWRGHATKAAEGLSKFLRDRFRAPGPS